LSRSRPTLGAILARRIAFFAILAMLLQLAVVFSDYYWNVGELSRLFVEQETERLASGIVVDGASVRYRIPENVQQRYSQGSTGYVARVRQASGALLFESCDAACEERFNSPRGSTKTIIRWKFVCQVQAAGLQGAPTLFNEVAKDPDIWDRP
jgi:hypothetical protein